MAFVRNLSAEVACSGLYSDRHGLDLTASWALLNDFIRRILRGTGGGEMVRLSNVKPVVDRTMDSDQ